MDRLNTNNNMMDIDYFPADVKPINHSHDLSLALLPIFSFLNTLIHKPLRFCNYAQFHSTIYTHTNTYALILIAFVLIAMCMGSGCVRAFVPFRVHHNFADWGARQETCTWTRWQTARILRERSEIVTNLSGWAPDSCGDLANFRVLMSNVAQEKLLLYGARRTERNWIGITL